MNVPVMLLLWVGLAPRAAPADFDGDGVSEVVVYRGGAWFIHDFSTGTLQRSVWTGHTDGCIALTLDPDGDRKANFSTFCSGSWHFLNDDGTYLKGIWTGGVAGDRPVPGDYDGDGRDDVVVFRGGAWLFFDFATGEYLPSASVWTGAPAANDGSDAPIPVPLDYDGDGRTDFSVFSGPAWHFFNHDGTYNKGIWTVMRFTGETVLPVAGDYDGDGREDIYVYRGDGRWFTFDFDTGEGGGITTIVFPHWTGGTPLPAPLDYDGDGTVDLTIFSGGPWHFYQDDGFYLKGIWTGGVAGDMPLSRRLLP